MKTGYALFVVAGVSASASAEAVLSARVSASAPIGSPAVLGSRENQTRYSNLTNFAGFAYAHGGASGGITKLVADDISRTGASGEALTEFSFTVANFNSSLVAVRPRVRFYAADGTGGAPGTLIAGYTFDAMWFSAGVASVVSSGLIPAGPAMPVNFWAALTFDNVGTATTDAELNLVGQALFDPPTQGSSADLMFTTLSAGSFLGNDPLGVLANFGQPAANFGWEINTAPAPGAIGLLGLGGLITLRRRR